MSAPAYSTITNGVDHRLTIIMHKDSGYYNITKTASLLQALKQEEEVVGNSPQPPIRGKLVRDWFRNRSTTAKIQECANLNGITIEDCSFIINEGVENEYRGTYIHPRLYDHFVMWLSPKYAMRVSVILEKHHYAANMKVLKEKDDKIDCLSADIRSLKLEMRQRDEEAKQKLDDQSFQIAELLIYGKQTTKTLYEVQDDLTETKEEVTIAKSYLEEKAFTSTKNPNDASKHHYFAATVFKRNDTSHVKLIAGQLSHVNKAIDKHLADERELLLEPFYNANGIDLRNNSFTEFKVYRKRIVQEENTRRVQADLAFNAQLKQEIRQYNKARGSNRKRYFSDEKRITPLLMIKDIPIKFAKTTIHYTKNAFISFDDVMKLVMEVNGITQASPLSKDEPKKE